MKLSGQRPELTGNLVSFYIVPLDPAYKTGLGGHLPIKYPIAIKIQKATSTPLRVSVASFASMAGERIAPFTLTPMSPVGRTWVGGFF
jgi:hypothetical protein